MSKKEKQGKKQGKQQNNERGGQAKGKQRSQKAAANADAAEDVKREQKLQAVLLADSFTTTFRPISLESPKVLLPLVNVPMLDYTFEFLAQNGVEEIIVFCVWHADKVQNYVNNSKWPSILSVKCISSSACLSAGDALRELDSLNIIRSDPFILISGDVISNINLKEAIAFHKQKRKEDPNNIMTVVLKHIQSLAGARPLLDDLVVAIDKNSSQILLFDDSYRKRNVQIPLELMEDGHTELGFHTDLLDCHVDICSPELILQFSDNFDYQDIRRDFIRNEVGNWALGKHIYGYFIQREYAARVQDFRSYHSICRDIVMRWVYPLVPDSQLLSDSSFVHSKHYSYREQAGEERKAARVARSAVVGECVVLRCGTVVEEGAKLRRAIFGSDCFVGTNAEVTESHVWDGARIESDAKVDFSIICNNVVVKKGAKIPIGCVISPGVVIGEGVVLPEFTHVSLFPCPSDETSSEEQSSLLGVDGKGFIWNNYKRENMFSDDDDDEDEQENETANISILKAQSMGCIDEELWKSALWTTMPAPEEDSDEDDDLPDDYDDDLFFGSSTTNGGIGGTDGESGNAQAGNSQFALTVSDMVVARHDEGHQADSLLMEIKGLKFAQNKSFSDCISGVIPALIHITAKLSLTPSTPQTELDEFNYKKSDLIGNWKKLLVKGSGYGFLLLKPLLFEEDDEVSLIESLEKSVLTSITNLLRKDQSSSVSSPFYSVFRFLLQICYDSELITDEAVLEWIDLRKTDIKLLTSDSSDFLIKRKSLFLEPQVQEFVEWIQEEGEDEETEDDGESQSQED